MYSCGELRRGLVAANLDWRVAGARELSALVETDRDSVVNVLDGVHVSWQARLSVVLHPVERYTGAGAQWREVDDVAWQDLLGVCDRWCTEGGNSIEMLAQRCVEVPALVNRQYLVGIVSWQWDEWSFDAEVTREARSLNPDSNRPFPGSVDVFKPCEGWAGTAGDCGVVAELLGEEGVFDRCRTVRGRRGHGYLLCADAGITGRSCAIPVEHRIVGGRRAILDAGQFIEQKEFRMANRRPYMLVKGEQLTSPIDPFTALMRLTQFTTESGLSHGEPTMSVVSAFPFPVNYPDEDGNTTPLPVNPELAWLPVFWLPDYLNSPFAYTDPETGEDRIESPEEWSVRVAMELEAAGFWDAETGTWLDVLKEYAHLDVDTEEGRAKIERWIAGDEPEFGASILDAVEMQLDKTNPEDPFWASNLSPDMAIELGYANTARSAEALVEVIEADGALVEGHPAIEEKDLADVAASQSVMYLRFRDMEMPTGSGAVKIHDYLSQVAEAYLEHEQLSPRETLERIVPALKHGILAIDRHFEDMPDDE